MQRPLPKPSRTVPHVLLLLLIALFLFSTGCSRIASHYTQPLFDDLTSSFMQQRDVVIAEQGTPSFLLIIDGLITHSPDSPAMLLAGAKAWSSYNTAFVGSKYPERNKILALKAKNYAIRALSLHSKAFDKVKDAQFDEFVTCLPSFKEKDVPFLFYTATSWAGWITANSSNWDAVADVPKVQALIERVIELDDGYYYGTPNAFMGVLLTIRPPALGGKPEEAREYFEKAVKLGEGKFLPTYVMYAKSYAMLVYEEELFHSLLNKVLESPVDVETDLILINTLAQRQARELLEEIREEEYFD
jgi:hypothetical protein